VQQAPALTVANPVCCRSGQGQRMHFHRLKRREFITLLGGVAAASPPAARAQQPANLPTIGFIGSDSPDPYTDRLRAFRLGLKSTGFTEGQNVAIEYSWAEGRNDRLPELTADLVRRQVAVIVAPTTPSVLVAKAATKTIPIVFFTAGDPVDLGLVASLSRPDSNLTGATTLTLEVGPKWVQLLHEMVPGPNHWPYSSTRPVQILPRPNRETYRRRPGASGCTFMCCEPAPTKTSTPPSKAFPDLARVDS
jgi:ABC transporter substrate binding protein